MVQDAIRKERDWFASAGIEVFGTDRSRKPARHLLPRTCLTSPPVSDDVLSPDRTRLRQQRSPSQRVALSGLSRWRLSTSARTHRVHQWTGYETHGAVLRSSSRPGSEIARSLASACHRRRIARRCASHRVRKRIINLSRPVAIEASYHKIRMIRRWYYLLYFNSLVKIA